MFGKRKKVDLLEAKIKDLEIKLIILQSEVNGLKFRDYSPNIQPPNDLGNPFPLKWTCTPYSYVGSGQSGMSILTHLKGVG